MADNKNLTERSFGSGLAGMIIGTIGGVLYAIADGEDLGGIIKGAVIGAGVGTITGAASPVVSDVSQEIAEEVVKETKRLSA